MGIFMMCLAAFLNIQSSTMLIAIGEKTGRLNYEELMADVFGNAGIYFLSLFVGVLAFGAMAAYLVIVGDTVPEILLASGSTTGAFADRTSVILLFGIFCMLPVSLLKDMSKLSYTSFISILADVLLTLIVLSAGAAEARYVQNQKCQRASVKCFRLWWVCLSASRPGWQPVGLSCLSACHLVCPCLLSVSVSRLVGLQYHVCYVCVSVRLTVCMSNCLEYY